MASTNILDRIISIEEAAEVYGRSADSLRKAAQRGRLDARKLGRGSGYGGSSAWVTTRDAVESYIIEADRWHARRAALRKAKPSG